MCQRAHTHSHLSAQTYLSFCHLLTSLSFYLNFARSSPRAFGRMNEAAWENYSCPFLWSRRGQRRAAEMAVSWPFLPCLILHRMGGDEVHVQGVDSGRAQQGGRCGHLMMSEERPPAGPRAQLRVESKPLFIPVVVGIFNC